MGGLGQGQASLQVTRSHTRLQAARLCSGPWSCGIVDTARLPAGGPRRVGHPAITEFISWAGVPQRTAGAQRATDLRTLLASSC